MPPSVEEVERQLDAGVWLRPGAVAVLFGTDRFNVVRWINAGKISFRLTPGGHRECNPEDVRTLLDDYRRVRRAGED